ncbi:VOC family protein [Oxalicibacterium faecigallinarum]|uniref:VOC domain-containing protein n=1 Tax=Oxalicibacterium faecigallinarum TaxID=573741 RepID=A0A8J3ARX3_9BURK|nr:VOC family protein [Oxalicibacterium faecigallinarum]GGI20458.1 hypothetical protein GCM10008066_24130 [Oxalicibacterium faecigallinarum]
MNTPLTLGVHHVGLAVPDLDSAVDFFVKTLNWNEKGRNDEYPAAFVSDGTITLTLWRVEDPKNAVAFNRRRNIGLHHLALSVSDPQTLTLVFERVQKHPDVVVEFEPKPMRVGSSTHHFICAMPSGVRIEFATC